MVLLPAVCLCPATLSWQAREERLRLDSLMEADRVAAIAAAERKEREIKEKRQKGANQIRTQVPMPTFSYTAFRYLRGNSFSSFFFFFTDSRAGVGAYFSGRVARARHTSYVGATSA